MPRRGNPNFVKGHPRLGGRKKGTPNHVTTEIKQLAAQVFNAAYWEKLRARVMAGQAPQMELYLMRHYYGAEPQRPVDVALAHPVPVEIINQFVST